jgi:hypothetical protein
MLQLTVHVSSPEEVTVPILNYPNSANIVPIKEEIVAAIIIVAASCFSMLCQVLGQISTLPNSQGWQTFMQLNSRFWIG